MCFSTVNLCCRCAQGPFDVQHARRRARAVFEHMQRYGGGHNYMTSSSRSHRMHSAMQRGRHSKQVRRIVITTGCERAQETTRLREKSLLHKLPVGISCLLMLSACRILAIDTLFTQFLASSRAHHFLALNAKSSKQTVLKVYRNTFPRRA